MKFITSLLMVFVSFPAFALPGIAVHQEEIRDVVMSIEDDGSLYEMTEDGWKVLGPPCPGRGPFRLEFYKSADMDDLIYIFAFDSEGTLWQTDGSAWILLESAPEKVTSPCLGNIYHFSEDSLRTVVLDGSGVLHLNAGDEDYRNPFDTFPHAPARDMTVHYDTENGILIPIILGSDGLVYLYINEEWQPADLPDSRMDIRRMETFVDPETGIISMIGIDGSGGVYYNDATGDFILSDHGPCPGDGPWEIALVHFESGELTLLCLDTEGALYISIYSEWVQFTAGYTD